jgi:hypothetical protein
MVCAVQTAGGMVCGVQVEIDAVGVGEVCNVAEKDRKNKFLRKF